MKNIFMSRGADKIVNTCVKVEKNEEVVIVTEESKLSIAEAIATEVYRVGAKPILTIMEPRKQDSEEPPIAIAAAMKASNENLNL